MKRPARGQPKTSSRTDRTMSPADRFDATIVPPTWRWAYVVLSAGAVVGLLWCLVAGVLLNAGDIGLVVLARAVALLAAAPASAAWLIRRAHRGEVTVTRDAVRLRAPGCEYEIPVASIAMLATSWAPWPDAGVALRLRSGDRLPVWIAVADPTALIERLAAEAPALGAVRDALAVRYAHHVAATPVRWWDRARWKIVAFALAPTMPLFRVDQIISYGGWRGEYYQYGLQPYLLHFGLYWLTVAIYLTMLATVLRLPAEIVALLATAAAPARAASVRRLVEAACRALYYGGVPVLLLLRFLPW